METSISYLCSLACRASFFFPPYRTTLFSGIVLISGRTVHQRRFGRWRWQLHGLLFSSRRFGWWWQIRRSCWHAQRSQPNWKGALLDHDILVFLIYCVRHLLYDPLWTYRLNRLSVGHKSINCTAKSSRERFYFSSSIVYIIWMEYNQRWMFCSGGDVYIKFDKYQECDWRSAGSLLRLLRSCKWREWWRVRWRYCRRAAL